MSQSRTACSLLALGWLSAAALAHAAPADIAAGKRLALNVCSSCHVVSDDQPTAPSLNPPAPSFARIANRPDTTVKFLRRFLTTTHKSLQTPPEMPSLMLTDQEADAAAAYIMSLRERP